MVRETNHQNGRSEPLDHTGENGNLVIEMGNMEKNRVKERGWRLV